MSTQQDLDAAVEKLDTMRTSGDSDWRKRLHSASFRGAAFEVLDSSMSGENRYAMHIYPDRNDHWAEPMGNAPDTFSISAFVGGDDYFIKRDRLIAALKNVDEPGELIDPFMGSVKVVCTTWDKQEVMADGRMAVFNMSFTIAGDPVLLITENPDVSSKITDSASDMEDDSREEMLEEVTVKGEQKRVSESANRQVEVQVDEELENVRNEDTVTYTEYRDLREEFSNELGSNGITEENMIRVQALISNSYALEIAASARIVE